jgi:methionyl-tRNA formyltransferase
MKAVVFVGSKPLGLRVLAETYRMAPQHLRAVVTVDDREDGRSALADFVRFSEETVVPLHVLSRGSELPGVIAGYSPHLCLVVGWYWILKPEVLAMASEGWLGIHASLLPRYRGGSPLVWALINGECETGASLFYFDEGMDTGDIVAQRRLDVGPDDIIADVLARTETLSVELMRDCYPRLLEGTAPRTPQDHSQATYGSMRGPEDGRITWTWTSHEIHNFIRAQGHPYPGAFCALPSGDRLRVWRASPFSHSFHGIPGQVVLIEADAAVVACGAGSAVRLHTVQADGANTTSGAEVLKVGQRLTQLTATLT